MPTGDPVDPRFLASYSLRDVEMTEAIHRRIAESMAMPTPIVHDVIHAPLRDVFGAEFSAISERIATAMGLLPGSLPRIASAMAAPLSHPVDYRGIVRALTHVESLPMPDAPVFDETNIWVYPAVPAADATRIVTYDTETSPPGAFGSLWGVNVIESSHVPPGDAYVISPPTYVGRMPIRTDVPARPSSLTPSQEAALLASMTEHMGRRSSSQYEGPSDDPYENAPG